MVLIKTNEAKCRDCYKCIRSCPLKSIQIKSHLYNNQTHARVLDEICVQCGRCTVVCPQKAKVVTTGIEEVKHLLTQNRFKVVASVAPSFPVQLPLSDPLLFPALLKQLGFSYVGMTAVGAELITHEHNRTNAPGAVISSACPVVVNLVEIHYPHLIPYLSSLVSPMIAHGRLLKKRFPGCVVVFIGPCIAKKGERRSEPVKDAVDYVLGFKEIWQWMEQQGIALDRLATEQFDGYIPDRARLFPAEGGQLLTTSLSTDIMNSSVQTVTGLENCLDYLNNFSGLTESQRSRFTEMLACSGGCLNGPDGVTETDIYSKKQKLLEFYHRTRSQATQSEPEPYLPAEYLHREFKARELNLPVPDEEQLREILPLTGKFSPEDELNCGACGYGSCREKAVAVFRGHAEPQMCIPYMRKRAESMSNLVLNAMPNGVIIADEELVIVEINPAAIKMFGGKQSKFIGEKLNAIMDPTEFQRVLKEKKMVKTDTGYLKNNIITRQIIFPLENLVVGIFIDVTKEFTQQNELVQVKTQTIERAEEVIKKQMTVAQEIAGILGETTAETKTLLNQLIKLMKN